ncbi:hypothetical protein BDP27DRAFT_1202034, partial [Rhodocollybia butyracea]
KGLEILSQKIAASASHDSEERFAAPKCYPGTRASILEELEIWIKDRSQSSAPFIFWLHGSAGVGKSAVAQSICKKFSDSCLAASFFFARSDPIRNNLSLFCTTIAHQLATSFALGPLLKDSIDNAIRHRRDIVHSSSLETQFQELIVKPCSQLSSEHWTNLPRLIVIDGLDECTDVKSQERLLCILREATTKSGLSFPFQFLICSRPEPRIRSAFIHPNFYSVVDSAGITEGREDIAMYLRDEFSNIRRDHGPAMAHVAEDWPGERIIQLLVKKACGQFVYARTILNYVGDFDYPERPAERLETILNNTVPTNSHSPYSDLDLLYKQILS